MPGTHIILSNTPLSRSQLLLAFDDLKYRHNLQVKEYYCSSNASIALSIYSGYPHLIYQDEHKLIILEGLVYNQTYDQTRASLAAIASDYTGKRDFRDGIRRFIDGCDGDYVVVIYFKTSNEVLIFNDRWARLPSFYTASQGGLVFSREFKYLLHFVDTIRFNRLTMAEFLTIGYNLGDKTLFEGIKRFNPASLIVGDGSFDNLSCESLFPTDFTTINVGLDRNDILQECVRLFWSSLSSRVSKAAESNLDIVVDLSGGYDSRTIFVALRKLEVPFKCCTDCSIADEGSVARRVAEQYGCNLLAFNANHTNFEVNTARDLTYSTDCMVNYWTTFRCYLDALEREKVLLPPIAHFMGFGGQFIRHPFRFKNGYSDFLEMLEDDIYTSFIRIDEACRILRLRNAEFTDNLRHEVSNFPESTTRDKVKHLNFEYYNKLVNGGENRHRLFSWTIQPLSGKDLFTFAMTSIPPSLPSFVFYIDFLKALDRKSTEVPVYRSKIQLHSKFDFAYLWLWSGLRAKLAENRYILKSKRRLYAGFAKIRKMSLQDNWAKMNIRRALESSRAVPAIMNVNAVNGFLQTDPRGGQLYQLLTLMLYIEAIESRFRGKIDA